MDNEIPLDSEYYERESIENYVNKKSITILKPCLTASSLEIPGFRDNINNISCRPKHILMTDFSNPHKAILYKLVIAAYNYVFFDDFSAITNKELFSSIAPSFIEWLNNTEIENQYEILKQYETYRFNLLGNHGGFSELNKIRSLFTWALDYSTELHVDLKSNELLYLYEIRKTKVSPNLNKAQKSLASYFGAMDWLRRDDFGIGSELYVALRSPKLTVNSLSLTSSVFIIELERYKRELSKFIQDRLEVFESLFLDSTNDKTKNSKCIRIGNLIYILISLFHDGNETNALLKGALELVLLSNSCSINAFLTLRYALESQDKCDELFLNKHRNKSIVSATFCGNNFRRCFTGNVFSFDCLHKLSYCDGDLPITKIEHLAFSWLMASLTVQPSDIFKLNHHSFRKIRVDNRVTHIECEYFKGRSKLFHDTRSLSTRTFEGRAIETYLIQQEKKKLNIIKTEVFISSGINSILGEMALLIETDAIQSKLKAAHKKQGNIPLIMPKTLTALIQNGCHTENVVANPKNYSLIERIHMASTSETPCQKGLFGLQAIKNSAVHAFSDPYTLHFLINRNSHSNRTEKINYLNSDNESWLNSSGLITREVMHDLINNVFDLGFEELCDNDRSRAISKFNSEFMDVTDNISYKSGEMLSRLCVVTEQGKGKINEVGVLQAKDDWDINQSLEPIYVLDSPVTAWRMINYLHEFKKNYKKLLACKPDYLYKTAIPTVEWMEYALTELSKESQHLGRKIFLDMVKNDVSISVFHSI
ncbi:hypothetical protein [Vibrio alginolyticus]|uniref:hypothetical protein n=1 Tax=Vibrio alginolyticus TaxID=663 RepID=UPI003850BACF